MLMPRDLEWAAGFLDGEGHFGTRVKDFMPRVTACQKDEWALMRLSRMFGGKVSYHAPQKAHWQPTYRWEHRGRRGAAIMMTLYSLLSPYRQKQIREALDAWRSIPSCAREYRRDGEVIWRSN